MYERERERERAINVLMINSIFVMLLFFFFLYFTYSISILDSLQIDVISSNGYRSVVRMTQVFDLEKGSISKTFLQVFKRENDLMH